MRSPNGICSGSVYLLKESEDDAFGILINLAAEPNHPWNILYLEKYLFAMTMADRDSCWSVYIARGITSDAVDLEKCKPPFSSTWDNNIPAPAELDAQEEVYGLSTSLYEWGDFQRYVLDCVESWSITPIDSEALLFKLTFSFLRAILS